MSLRKLRYIYGKSESSKVTYTGDYPPATVSKHLPKEMYSDPSNTSFLKRCVSSPDKVHIKICDFSESYIFKGPAYAPDRPFYGRMPYFFKAPEIIFHDVSVPSPSIDIWYLAIVMHMMICLKMPLFGYADENLVRQMVLTLGKLPDKWWNQWSDRAKYFDENGNLLEDSELKFKQYVTSLNIIADLYSEEEAADFESIIRRMVRYNPEDRITADEVYRLLPAQWKERRNTASSLAKVPKSSADRNTITPGHRALEHNKEQDIPFGSTEEATNARRCIMRASYAREVPFAAFVRTHTTAWKVQGSCKAEKDGAGVDRRLALIKDGLKYHKRDEPPCRFHPPGVYESLDEHHEEPDR
ncbi:kinase-like domain-containing protein [Cyathus striatus]|nr:kinase-like domain-containing protein [Cyathus striatus]